MLVMPASKVMSNAYIRLMAAKFQTAYWCSLSTRQPDIYIRMPDVGMYETRPLQKHVAICSYQALVQQVSVTPTSMPS